MSNYFELGRLMANGTLTKSAQNGPTLDSIVSDVSDFTLPTVTGTAGGLAGGYAGNLAASRLGLIPTVAGKQMSLPGMLAGGLSRGRWGFVKSLLQKHPWAYALLLGGGALGAMGGDIVGRDRVAQRRASRTGQGSS